MLSTSIYEVLATIKRTLPDRPICNPSGAPFYMNTFYAAWFETDDVIYRVFVLLKMMGAAALTVNIHVPWLEHQAILLYHMVLLRVFL